MARTKKTDVILDGKKVTGVTSGSHLKVTHFEDGTTQLEWDHDALLRDVQEAIASVGTVTVKEDKPKRTRTKKTS